MSGRSRPPARRSRRARGARAPARPRGDLDRVGLPQRALGERREPAQRLDLDVEQVDADRPVLGGRVDVEDAAAHGELAAVLDLLDALVAGGDELAGDLVEVDEVALAQVTKPCGRSSGSGTFSLSATAETTTTGGSAPPRRRRAARPARRRAGRRGAAAAPGATRRSRRGSDRSAPGAARATRAGRRRGRGPGGRRRRRRARAGDRPLPGARR